MPTQVADPLGFIPIKFHSQIVTTFCSYVNILAQSCDLLPSRIPRDIWDFLAAAQYWDLIIAHPSCTHLASSGAKHFAAKRADGRQQAALDFVRRLMAIDCPWIAIENPMSSVISMYIRKPDQIIHRWEQGYEASKQTCLWLKGSPLLTPTQIVGKGEFHATKGDKRIPKWYNLPPSPTRAQM
jgi:hypothetical protein